MTNFDSDDHAISEGFLLGLLMSKGIDAAPIVDEDGNYTPRIVVKVHVEGRESPIPITVEVLPP